MEDPFLATVPKALTYLYHEGRLGHWSDVRTTAESVLALLGSGESLASMHLCCASEFLVNGFKTEETGGSWSSELWDTALAVRALNRLPLQDAGVLERATSWMLAKQLSDGSFDGEPWDTMFVCLAILEMGRPADVQKSLEWLLTLQTKHGVVVSRHYTGLFCQVVGRALETELPSDLRQRLREAAMRALLFLWDNYNPETLWGTGSWTNAYIVHGMVALKHPQILGRYDEVIAWYSKRQSDNGAWDDCVRTAIVLTSLLELKFAYETSRCNGKQLSSLTVEFFARSTQEQLVKAIQLRTRRTPVIRSRKFIDKDEFGNRVITLTPERQLLLAIVGFVLSVAWGIITNWHILRPFLWR